MLSDEIKKVPIDEKKLSQMKKMIISAERKNLKTGEFNSQDMVKAIRKIIWNWQKDTHPIKMVLNMPISNIPAQQVE